MSDISLTTLAALPRPDIIQTLDYEAVLARLIADLVASAPALGFVYDVDGLETDPAVILLQTAAYQEMLLRARGNDIARSAYLFYAVGSAVDHLGAFHDCVRLTGETDARYKIRIIDAIKGRSTGGTAPRYRLVAMSASLRVADAIVYTVGTSPRIEIAIFAADNNGVADASLLDAVRAAVTAPDVRMVNDTINVRSAVVTTVPVVARLWLLPDTDAGIVDRLRTGLAPAWAAEAGLGRDLTRSWLVSRLMIAGVQRVEIDQPTADVVMQPHQAVRISTVTITVMGRDA